MTEQKPEQEQEQFYTEKYFDMHLKALYDIYTSFEDDPEFISNFPYKIYYKDVFVGIKTIYGMDWGLPEDGYEFILNELEDRELYVEDEVYEYLLMETSENRKLQRFLLNVKDEILNGTPPFKWVSEKDLSPIPEESTRSPELEVEQKEEPVETYKPIEDAGQKPEPVPELEPNPFNEAGVIHIKF